MNQRRRLHKNLALSHAFKNLLTHRLYFYIIRNMKMPQDAEARIHYFASLLKALSSPARLKILRLLLKLTYRVPARREAEAALTALLRSWN